MLEYSQYMPTYEGEHLEIMVEPEKLKTRPRGSRHVLVTDDETYFYANDSKRAIWLEQGETVLRKKCQGRAVMVSAFACSCHGLFH